MSSRLTKEHLAVAIATLAGAFAKVPDLNARYARKSDPTKLPA